MKSFILSLLVACVSVTAFSQNQYTIIPEPQKLIPATGVYSFKSNTAITVIAYLLLECIHLSQILLLQ